MKVIRTSNDFPYLHVDEKESKKLNKLGLFNGMLTENRISIKSRSFKEKKEPHEIVELKKAKSYWKRNGINKNSVNFKHGFSNN